MAKSLNPILVDLGFGRHQRDAAVRALDMDMDTMCYDDPPLFRYAGQPYTALKCL